MHARWADDELCCCRNVPGKWRAAWKHGKHMHGSDEEASSVGDLLESRPSVWSHKGGSQRTLRPEAECGGLSVDLKAVAACRKPSHHVLP